MYSFVSSVSAIHCLQVSIVSKYFVIESILIKLNLKKHKTVTGTGSHIFRILGVRKFSYVEIYTTPSLTNMWQMILGCSS